jgi:hypothetical protein
MFRFVDGVTSVIFLRWITDLTAMEKQSKKLALPCAATQHGVSHNHFTGSGDEQLARAGHLAQGPQPIGWARQLIPELSSTQQMA